MVAPGRPSSQAPSPVRPAPAAIARLGRSLLSDLPTLTESLVAAILREDPSYPGPERLPLDDLRASCRRNLQHVLATLVGDADMTDTQTLAPPRETGSRRAEQGVPLESVLHAYRLGFRTIWEAMVAQARSGDGDDVEALVDAASEIWAIVDLFSAAVADAYRSTELALSRRDDRRREALLDALLEGRGRGRALAAQAAAGLELPEHGRYAVLVLDDGPGVAAGAAAQEALQSAGLRTQWRSRVAEEVALVALPGGQDAGVVVTALRAVPELRAGVGPAVDGLAHVDVGYRAALTAVRALPPGACRVVELDELLPAALLVTAPDLAGRLVRRALSGVLELAVDERDLLLDTLRAWLACGGSAGQTAAKLYCHRNTVLNRLHRVEGLTGRSAERVDDLVEWSLALLALDVLTPGGTAEPPRPLG